MCKADLLNMGVEGQGKVCSVSQGRGTPSPAKFHNGKNSSRRSPPLSKSPRSSTHGVFMGQAPMKAQGYAAIKSQCFVPSPSRGVPQARNMSRRSRTVSSSSVMEDSGRYQQQEMPTTLSTGDIPTLRGSPPLPEESVVVPDMFEGDSSVVDPPSPENLPTIPASWSNASSPTTLKPSFFVGPPVPKTYPVKQQNELWETNIKVLLKLQA